MGSWLSRVCQGQRGLEAVCKGLARYFSSSSSEIFPNQTNQNGGSLLHLGFGNNMNVEGGEGVAVVMVNVEVDL